MRDGRSVEEKWFKFSRSSKMFKVFSGKWVEINVELQNTEERESEQPFSPLGKVLLAVVVKKRERKVHLRLGIRNNFNSQ